MTAPEHWWNKKADRWTTACAALARDLTARRERIEAAPRPRRVTASFDVAVVPARLAEDGSRDISAPTWVRVIATGRSLVDAHLCAAQLVGCHGMVTEVLLRE